MPISLSFTFESIEDVQLFLKDYNQTLNRKTKPKKDNDKRGHKTKEFHQAVKTYHLDHPGLSYLECLKLYNKTDVEN